METPYPTDEKPVVEPITKLAIGCKPAYVDFYRLAGSHNRIIAWLNTGGNIVGVLDTDEGNISFVVTTSLCLFLDGELHMYPYALTTFDESDCTDDEAFLQKACLCSIEFFAPAVVKLY